MLLANPPLTRTAVTDSTRLRHFVQSMTRLLDQGASEQHIFDQGKAMLVALVSVDDWLDSRFALAAPDRYQQYLLHCDPLERFSVTSFVWGPGQGTPVHDHTVWGMVGVLRGAERCEEFKRDTSGALVASGEHFLPVGAVDLVSPTVGDVHRVSNALADGVSVSIHVYGANIGKVRRHVFEMPGAVEKVFISGYVNGELPNIW
jgi:predicted metal-dependent enzyme (double-stranded beta helix superfamily)